MGSSYNKSQNRGLTISTILTNFTLVTTDKNVSHYTKVLCELVRRDAKFTEFVFSLSESPKIAFTSLTCVAQETNYLSSIIRTGISLPVKLRIMPSFSSVEATLQGCVVYEEFLRAVTKLGLSKPSIIVVTCISVSVNGNSYPGDSFWTLSKLPLYVKELKTVTVTVTAGGLNTKTGETKIDFTSFPLTIASSSTTYVSMKSIRKAILDCLENSETGAESLNLSLRASIRNVLLGVSCLTV